MWEAATRTALRNPTATVTMSFGEEFDMAVHRVSEGLQVSMLFCMQSTSVRIDTATHDELKRLALELDTTVGRTVTLAVRALRQELVGAELRSALRQDEVAWLDADVG